MCQDPMYHMPDGEIAARYIWHVVHGVPAHADKRHGQMKHHFGAER